MMDKLCVVVDIRTNARIVFPAVLFAGNAADTEMTPEPWADVDWVTEIALPPLELITMLRGCVAV
jgi:hypothetical protein